MSVMQLVFPTNLLHIYGIPNPFINVSELSSDDKEDLMAQIDRLKRNIHIKFMKLQADLIKSLKELSITPACTINSNITSSYMHYD